MKIDMCHCCNRKNISGRDLISGHNLCVDCEDACDPDEEFCSIEKETGRQITISDLNINTGLD